MGGCVSKKATTSQTDIIIRSSMDRNSVNINHYNTRQSINTVNTVQRSQNLNNVIIEKFYN